MFWKKLWEENRYEGWRKIIRKRFELPNGEKAEFDILGAKHYVTVAAVTDEERFVMVRQFRPGPEQVLVSFPEGAIDEGESLEEAARRELREETGFAAQSIQLLKTFRSSYTNQLQHCLLATGCRPAGSQQTEADEFIEVFTLSIPELRRLMRDTADNSFSNVGCAFLALERLEKLL